MPYWLVKQEPTEFSWQDMLQDGIAVWDGVRNYQARNNLQAMHRGDRVLFYHSVKEKQVVGVAEVTREAFPDPTTDDSRWVAVEMKPIRTLEQPVTLAQIKAEAALQDIALIRQSRLSVMPLEPGAFERILQLGHTCLDDV